MPDLQTMTTMVCESSVLATSTSNTVYNLYESPLCLSRIIRDTILIHTSTKNAIAIVYKWHLDIILLTQYTGSAFLKKVIS
jgi:hypothetical protein